MGEVKSRSGKSQAQTSQFKITDPPPPPPPPRGGFKGTVTAEATTVAPPIKKL